MSIPESYYSWTTPAPATKAAIAYQKIRREIIEGRLAPGQVLDQEALAIRFDLSTTPIREALSRLESDELVINPPHRKTIVAPLSRTLLQETYTVRMSLDPLAVELAATEMTPDERHTLTGLVDRQPDGHDPVELLYFNRALHRAIYSSCGNRVLTQILDVLWDRSDRYRLITLKNNTTVHIASSEHSELIEAVLARDGAHARSLMYQHIHVSLQRMLDVDLDSDAGS